MMLLTYLAGYTVPLHTILRSLSGNMTITPPFLVIEKKKTVTFQYRTTSGMKHIGVG
eukprot:NODE_1433_length_541_cov_60.640244_g1356_i0.p3 GENE.NODE_1433_length_541_cov_60.640244_g1356_i0~~NODE_1433_length_541_cov_60.640244_g1356_i0.p3  ORF type:complete len:57 (-),score=8.60 NODE_1433_length_541_cov_60.640244_g1356_i0:69-239(-)